MNLKDLVRSFSEVVIMSSGEKEEVSGHQNVYGHYEIAAKDRRSGHYVHVTIRWGRRTMGNRLSSHEENRREITADEHAAFARAHGGIRDTPEFYEAERRKDDDRAAARAELERLTPKCPDCGVPFVTRTRRWDSKPFWGCPKWPSCQRTDDKSPALQRRLDDLSRRANAP